VDEMDGGEPHRQGNEDEVGTPIFDGGAVGGQIGVGVSGVVGETVPQAQSAAGDGDIRGERGVYINDDVLRRFGSDEGEGLESDNTAIEKLKSIIDDNETPTDEVGVFNVGDVIEYNHNNRDISFWEVVSVNENGNPDIRRFGETGILRDFHYFNVEYKLLSAIEAEKARALPIQLELEIENRISGRLRDKKGQLSLLDEPENNGITVKVNQVNDSVKNIEVNGEVIYENPHFLKEQEAKNKLLTTTETENAAPSAATTASTRAYKLYAQFEEMFPQIVSGEYNYMCFGKAGDAFEPLSVEHLGSNRYSFMMWYVQNGDLMRDPDFEFTLDKENKTLNIHEYQQDGVPPVGTVYERVHDDDGRADEKLLAALERNFAQVLKSAKEAERPLTEYHLPDGTEIKNTDSEPEQPEPEPNDDIDLEDNYDETPELRRTLNDFSLKHGLGELNLYSNGDTLVEIMKNGEPFTIGEVKPPVYGVPHTPESLKAELDRLENAVKDISNIRGRLKLVEKLGGVSALPKAIDNLPEIVYAQTPHNKFSDNIAALRELKRLERLEELDRELYDKHNTNL